MSSRLLACLRPATQEATPRTETRLAAHQHLVSLVQGRHQPVEGGGGVLLAVAAALRAQTYAGPWQELDLSASGTDLLLLEAAGSSLESSVLADLVGLLIDHGASPAAFDGRAIVVAVQAGHPQVAEALLARCGGGAAAVGGMALLPLLQDAISTPAFAPGLAGGQVGVRELQSQLHKICASRTGYELLEVLGSGQPLVLVPAQLTGRSLGLFMQLQALRRTAVVLQLLVQYGAAPVSAEQEGVPGMPREVWEHLREAATAWPSSWSQAVHCRYHPSFRAAARELLLAARRGITVASPAVGECSGAGTCIVGTACSAAERAECRIQQDQDRTRSQQEGAEQGRVFQLPPLVVEQVIRLMAARQRDWVQPG
ncbi:hypothetical protein ACK3TF_005852 [Chlorella vulgaris]